MDAPSLELVTSIAYCSRVRREDGIRFWKGFFRGRIERFAHRDLTTFVARMCDECGVDPLADEHPIHLLESASASEAAEAERTLRTQAGLLDALAFDRIRSRRENKK